MRKDRKNHDSVRIVKTLFGNYFKKSNGLIEIRFIKNDRKRSKPEFYPFGGFSDEDIKHILKMNETHNVYFGVNPRPLNKRKKQDDIKNIICLWADIDGKDFQDGKAQAKQMIDNFELRPNIIVDSGNGYHGYWIFKEPIISIDKEKRQCFNDRS